MNNIAKVRKAKGISQKELAERLNITAPSLSQIEHGDNPKFRTLVKIAQALDCGIVELIDEQQN